MELLIISAEVENRGVGGVGWAMSGGNPGCSAPTVRHIPVFLNQLIFLCSNLFVHAVAGHKCFS